MNKFLGIFAGLAVLASVSMADFTPSSKEDAVLVNDAQSVTNGQAVTINAGMTVLTGINGVDAGTNTITLVAPGKAGLVAFVGFAGTSNNVAIADSGTVALSAAFEGNANDVLTLISISTSVWAEVSKSAN